MRCPGPADQHMRGPTTRGSSRVIVKLRVTRLAQAFPTPSSGAWESGSTYFDFAGAAGALGVRPRRRSIHAGIQLRGANAKMSA